MFAPSDLTLCVHGNWADQCLGCGWAQVHEVNERYWATHARDGALLRPPATGFCAHGVHKRCNGIRRARDGNHRVLGPCGCFCHEEGE